MMLWMLLACAAPADPPLTSQDTAPPPPPQIGIEEGLLDFGEVLLGSNSLRSLIIHNIGGGVLTISALELVPESPWFTSQLSPPFSISSVAPVQIYFSCRPAPEDGGGVTYTGELLIRSDAERRPEVAIPVRCAAVAGDTG